MNQLRKFMYGRYGFDQCSQALVICSLIASLIGSIARSSLLIYVSYIPLFYAIYRILSKNINKRTQENYKFLEWSNSVKNKFRKSKQSMNGTKTHKYYNCPRCKQKIRIPKGKGKICITCPKCKTEFIKRT